MSFQVASAASPAPLEPDSVAALEVSAELLQGGRLLVAVAVLCTAWLLSIGAGKALQLTWKAGADPERRLALAKLVFDLLLATSVVWLGLRNVAAIAPGSSSLAVGLLALFVLAGLYPELQNLMAGVSIGIAEQLRPKDLVSVGKVHGEILRLGTTHIEMRVDDGSVVFLPNRVFRSQVVKVERKRRVWPIAVRLAGSFTLSEIERLRIAAILCPYRSQHTQVTIEQNAAGRGGLEGVIVKICCWSNAGTEQAIHYVEQLGKLHLPQ